MKPKRRVVLAVAALLLGAVGQSMLAQDTKAKQTTSRSSQPRFVKLADGVQVVRLFQKKAPQGAEVAILRLSQDKYKQFKQDPKKFVNETYEKRIFLFEVTDVAEATYKGQEDVDDAQEVEVVLTHNYQWIAAYVATRVP